MIRQRLREARFPEVKTLDTFDFAAADGVNATQIHSLARGEWVTAPENLILAGPIGTGKTHLAIAEKWNTTTSSMRCSLRVQSGRFGPRRPFPGTVWPRSRG